MLNEFLFPKIKEDDMDDIWFPQDGATCHTVNVKIDLSGTIFENRIISRNSDVNWPPRSCDVTPLDYFLWEPLRISITLTIQRWLRPWNTKSKLPFMRLKPKKSKMYWKIELIEWRTVRPAVAVIWMMLCFILKWKGSIFLIKPYFWKNIHKFFFIADSNSKWFRHCWDVFTCY